MTEEAKTEETALKPVVTPDVSIHEILGFVRVEKHRGFHSVKCDEGGALNNTRWVFDVQVKGSGSILLELLNPYGRIAKTDIEPSFHLTPMTFESHKTLAWGRTDKATLMLGFEGEGEATFRVDVDIIGSNRR